MQTKEQVGMGTYSSPNRKCVSETKGRVYIGSGRDLLPLCFRNSAGEAIGCGRVPPASLHGYSSKNQVTVYTLSSLSVLLKVDDLCSHSDLHDSQYHVTGTIIHYTSIELARAAN